VGGHYHRGNAIALGFADDARPRVTVQHPRADLRLANSQTRGDTPKVRPRVGFGIRGRGVPRRHNLQEPEIGVQHTSENSSERQGFFSQRHSIERDKQLAIHGAHL
jgi:hypothetical protein